MSQIKDLKGIALASEIACDDPADQATGNLGGTIAPSVLTLNRIALLPNRGDRVIVTSELVKQLEEELF